MNALQRKAKIGLLTTICAMTFAIGSTASAARLGLVNSPLFLSTAASPLNMLIVGRDHKLYYEAYNDHSDLNNDGVLDIGYKPTTIDYFGYFDSYKCYQYSGGRFAPVSKNATKKCSGYWSGDWLNYMTMSRMDALRAVLYGGMRSTDTASDTTLERSFIPQDAHSWGKSYESVAVNGYDINDYTPSTLVGTPTANSSHIFASTTPYGTSLPLMRVLKNVQYSGGTPLKTWNYLSVERPVAGDTAVTNVTAGGAETRSSITGNRTDYTVRVKVCDSSLGLGTLESNCQGYIHSTSGVTTYKPIGLLQTYGENDSMKFGLLTGSYANNLDGGVLRKAVTSFTNEVDLDTGIFTNASGIIATLNGLKIAGFKSDFSYDCNNGSAWVTTRAIINGECQNWGNPVAEMMYEGLRYFAGKAGPTAEFKITAGAGQESGLGLPVATWDGNTDPYKKAGSNPNGSCAKPFETVISDINTSYDTDKLPGASFGSSFTGDLPGLNVTTLGQTIWNGEFGAGTTKNAFIGEVWGSSVTGPAASAPTAKTVSSFGNIRGLAPEEPTKQGGYYSASVAYYGLTNDINTTADAKNAQNVGTFVVALASPLPRIEIKSGARTITLIPFAKSVAGASIVSTSSFQPTNQIVDFYVDSLTTTSGKFRVNFEDVEQGADHDMDAIVLYEYLVKGDGTVDVKLTSEYAAGGITQHMGYIISGTTHDGIYLEVTDQRGGDVDTDVDYALDTPPGQLPGGTWADNRALPYGQTAPNAFKPLQPITTTRNFTAGTTTGAELLHDPLWYAAKWGGFEDGNKDGLPNPRSEWDADNDGTPDNYFLVTNALNLGAKMASAFNEILKKTASASSASVNSGSISTRSRVYQATFDSGEWTGHLLSYPVKPDGSLEPLAEWDAADKIPVPSGRKIFTKNTAEATIPFKWANVGLDTTLWGKLSSDATEAENILNYLSGDQSKEANQSGGTYRIRKGVLGDLINSAPLFIGAPNLPYSDKIETAVGAKYSAFRISKTARDGMILAGGNDGMLHAFAASTGTELFAYIPTPVFSNLKRLATPSYSHRYFVDGSPNMTDAYFGSAWHTVVVGGLNKGGQGIYALDVTNPTTFSSTNVLWEFTDRSTNGDADLGFTFSQPALVKLNNGTWAAIFGNGYNNTQADGFVNTGTTAGHAFLYIVNLETGVLIRKIDTGVGDAATPNGLATPAVVDTNGDFKADYVYAGDLRGNMWKFDITDASVPANWKVAYHNAASQPAPLYTATDGTNPQPITSRPEIARGPSGTGMVVVFGTGKYLEAADKLTSPQYTQSVYGIYDKNVNNTDASGTTNSDAFTGRTALVAQSIIAEQSITIGDLSNGGFKTNVRVTSQNSVDATTKRGWYMDLLSPPVSTPVYQGEKVVSNPLYRDGRFIFTTLIPKSDPCEYGGTSWLMELDALTGRRIDVPPVDINNDGVIDASDMITVAGVPIVPSGVESSVGITPEPGILTDPNKAGMEYKYFAGTSGDIQKTGESRDPMSIGRQSWKESR